MGVLNVTGLPQLANSGAGKNFLGNMGAFLGSDSSMPKGNTPPPDGRLNQQNEALRIKASQLRDSIPQRANEQMDIFGDQARHQLAQDLTGARRNSSARGLLYGGQHQGTEAALRSQMGQQMAQQRAKINRSLEDEAFNAENASLESLLNQRSLENDRQRMLLAQAMADDQYQSAANSNLFGAVGQNKGTFKALGI